MNQKLKYVCYALVVAYFASMYYIINKGIDEIRISSFKIGCMSVQAPVDAIDQCKAQAELKFK